MLRGERADHIIPALRLSDGERRSAQIQDHLRALADERFHRSGAIKTARQIFFRPDVLADRDANNRPAHFHRNNGASRLEVTVFVENVVGRQQRLEKFAHWLAVLEKRRGVEEWLAGLAVDIDITDEERNLANFTMKRLERCEIQRDEARFEDEVLRWIARDRQFRSEHQFGAVLDERAVRFEDPAMIPGKIPDRRVPICAQNQLLISGWKSPRTLAAPLAGGRGLLIHVSSDPSLDS